MKSTSSAASFLLHTVANNMVFPIFTTTEPSACLASLPVSMVICRPSPKSNVFVTIILCLFLINTKKGNLSDSAFFAFEIQGLFSDI